MDLIAGVLVLFVVLSAFAEPDIDKPFSPIYFDKESYSWTEKVKIKIVAPSWNAHRHAIDTIGGDDEHPIKISTREHEIKPYRLAETDLNSGVFVGEVILTGFLHDADGDGDFDVIPKTSGTGPTNGFLESQRNDALTLSFEFVEGKVITESVPIAWNVGYAEFLQDRYLIDEEAVIRIVDADMNLNPEAVDQFDIDVVSDSDTAGVRISMIERSKDAGLFEGKISFTQNGASSGSRLFSTPGDHVIAKYDDYTLPSPYGKSDDLEISASMILDSNVHPLERVSFFDISLVDISGNKVTTPHTNDQLQILSRIENLQDFNQDFVALFQITAEDDSVVSISWFQGHLNSLQGSSISQHWIPTKQGTYEIEIFVWESLNKPIPLASSKNVTYSIQR